MTWSVFRRMMGGFALAVCLTYGLAAGLSGSAFLDLSEARAQSAGNVPGGSLGNASDAEMWRAVRKGIRGTVSIPDKQAGQLVQANGDSWRAVKNGPISQGGGILLLVAVVAILAFYLIRGPIRVISGPDPQGRTIERFNAVDRAVHWITASSFVVLGLTGLNVLYGRYVLKPVLGADAFAALTYWGKMAHNYIAFAFILGVILMFILWLRHNIPSMHDLRWMARAGGMFSKGGAHIDTPRFNAGQKVVFWLVVIGGGSLSISGLALMFPGQITPWAGTFGILNVFGADLPTQLTALEEIQLSILWHSIIALVMIAVILGHIYLGTLGMEGALGAVASGQVDLNWAREHHNLWAREVEAEEVTQQPAE